MRQINTQVLHDGGWTPDEPVRGVKMVVDVPVDFTRWEKTEDGYGGRSVFDHRERVTVEVTVDLEDLVLDVAERAARNRKSGKATRNGRTIRAKVKERSPIQGSYLVNPKV